MVHRISLYKLKNEVTEEVLEGMMREARMHLLKIPEVLNIRCGKRIDGHQEWPFFVALDFESMEKQKIGMEDPVYVAFEERTIKRNVVETLSLTFEMEPYKDVRYS